MGLLSSGQASIAVQVAGYPIGVAHLTVTDRATGGNKGTVTSTEFDGEDSNEFMTAVTR